MLTVNGLHVVEHGPLDGPVVVLVHGTMDRHTSFAKVAKRLEGDVRVVTYDRRGYARSRDVGPPYAVADHVDDLLAVIAGRPCAVVGHSFGGNVALAAATRSPDLVRAAGAYESPMSWEPFWPSSSAGARVVEQGEDPAAAAEGFMRRVIGDELWERMPSRTRADRRAEGPVLVAELTDLRRTAPYDWRALTVPVLPAHGERSKEHQRLGAATLGQRVGRSPFVVVGAGHNAHTSHPDGFEAFARAVLALATR